MYSLVAVGLPHHHGVGVGGLAGGDHGGLVEDGGDSGESGHFVVRIKVWPSDAFEPRSADFEIVAASWRGAFF